MDVSVNARVGCSDGFAGHVSALIMNPLNDELTHIVVRQTGFLGVERLVAIEMIANTSPEEVTLNCTLAKLNEQPAFITSQFIPASPVDGMEATEAALYWPYISVAAGDESVTVDVENLPEGEVALHGGAGVYASDGRVGRIDDLGIAANGKISYLVLREGHLWGQKEITIPVDQIDHMSEDGVYLKLTKQQVAALPAIPIQQRRAATPLITP